MNPLLKASGVQTLTGFLFLSLVASWRPASASQNPAPLPLVRAWSFTGNRAISRDSLLSWVSLKAGAVWSRETYDDDLERIRSGYAQNGFFAMTIESDTVLFSVDSSHADLILTLTEGRRAIVGGVHFRGAGAFPPPELASASGIVEGDPFSVAEIETGIRRILRLYESTGYPLAAARIADVVVEGKDDELSAAVTIDITEGPKAMVLEARVQGNDRTQEEVILREIRLGSGRPFDPEMPRQVQRALQRLDIFSGVSEPQFYVLENGDLGLEITVREGNTNRFDGAVGYIPPSTEGRQGYVTGLIDVGFRNLFGTGRRLDARWRRIDRLSQDLALRYKEPWLFGLPVSVSGAFGQRKQDSSYVQRTFDINASLMITDELSLGVSFATTSVLPGQLAVAAVTKNASTGFALSVQYDSRDRVLAPTEGAVYQTSYERGTKRIEAGPLSPEAVTETKERITADVEAYFLIVRPHLIAVAAHGRDVRTPLLDVSDLFRLGGARTLRGYAEDQFLGSRVVWTSLEYRLLAGNRSYLYAFFDWAYVATVSGGQSVLPSTEVRPYGYGAGLLVETVLGIVDVSVAAGKGDTFSTAKLHLRLVNEF